MTEVISTAELW